MKRVICLYRVSTKGQVDKDDIPMQRIECRKFIETQGWTLVGEYAEKGVSGFKVSAEKRDAIMSIRKEAERGAFDVLLVFMFDRLGRRDDETPFLVEWFISKGIEVWSTREGQQKMESRADKLINYIRYPDFTFILVCASAKKPWRIFLLLIYSRAHARGVLSQLKDE